MAIIEAIGVHKKFNQTDALVDLNWTIEAGRVTTILGANGAGKTTFIRCALGLTNPTSGNLLVFDRTPGSRECRYRTGAMLQDANLPDLLNPKEHITLFSSYYRNPLSVDRVIELCQIGSFAKTYYKKLSGGQKRRVQFALAIVGQPDLLFLDEPTTGLDRVAREVVWSVVRELAREGRTIVLTTHNLAEAESLADEVAILSNGRLVLHADTDSLRSKVQGETIRCITCVPFDRLNQIVGVASVTQSGRFVEVTTQNAANTLRDLLSLDLEMKELTVSKSSLETAVRHLEDESHDGKSPGVATIQET